MSETASRRRASVADVARRAGVSAGTVSNVLNRPEIVKPETREQVEKAIDELAFVRKRTGRITTVAALVRNISNPFFTEVARGAEDRLALDDHTLMLASSDDDPDRESRYLRIFEQHGVLGMLVVPGSSGTRHLEALSRRGVRIVLLDYPSSIPNISSVSLDNEIGGMLAATHLFQQGHQGITFLNGPHAIRQCLERLAGVRRAASEAGLNPHTAVNEVQLPSMDADAGDAAMQSLVAQAGGIPPAALFCVTDRVAIGAQRALRRIGGTRMLSSVAMVGYDDIEMASELARPLTSIRQPARAMGYRAADILLTGGQDAPAQHVVFQPELVVRASSRVRRPRG